MIKNLPFTRWKNKVLTEFNSRKSQTIPFPSYEIDFFELPFLEKAELCNIFAQKVFKKFFLKEQWFIAYRKKGTFNLNKFTEREFNIIEPPKHRFYADPFPVNIEDKDYVFFEDFNYARNKGEISYIEIDKNGNHSAPEVVLQKDYHLSYPFIFTYKDRIYMIPETNENNSIQIFEAVDFPHKWSFKKDLINNIRAVDATIVQYNEKYWLFANEVDNNDSSTRDLLLFYSDSPFGNWTPHPKNPVISDVMLSRPAGKMFYHNDKLIRPSQESSIRYGYSLNFNEVQLLSETDYKEANLAKIRPEFIPDNLAIHTFNSNNSIEIIDGMRMISKL